MRSLTRPGFNPWVGEIPGRRKWQPTPVFLPGESHGQRSLAGYSPWGHKELDVIWVTEHRHTRKSIVLPSPDGPWGAHKLDVQEKSRMVTQYIPFKVQTQEKNWLASKSSLFSFFFFFKLWSQYPCWEDTTPFKLREKYQRVRRL